MPALGEGNELTAATLMARRRIVVLEEGWTQILLRCKQMIFRESIELLSEDNKGSESQSFSGSSKMRLAGYI